MDCGNDYILMCKKAKEIQALRCNPERNYYDVGDWLAIKDELIIELRQQRVDDGVPNMVANVECYCLCDPDEWGFPSNSIWLPRQDQLQAMLGDKFDDCVDMLERFYWSWAAYKTDEEHPWREFIEPRDKEKILKDFTSMEQLWLAFIMGEKYNKIWDSDKKVWGKA